MFLLDIALARKILMGSMIPWGRSHHDYIRSTRANCYLYLHNKDILEDKVSNQLSLLLSMFLVGTFCRGFDLRMWMVLCQRKNHFDRKFILQFLLGKCVFHRRVMGMLSHEDNMYLLGTQLLDILNQHYSRNHQSTSTNLHFCRDMKNLLHNLKVWMKPLDSTFQLGTLHKHLLQKLKKYLDKYQRDKVKVKLYLEDNRSP